MTSKKICFGWIDIITISILFFLLYYIYHRVSDELNYSFKWSLLLEYIVRFKDNKIFLGVIAQGFFYTLKLSFWGILLGFMLGFFMGVLRTFRRPFFRIFSLVYVEIFRNIPPIVLIFIFYFFVSEKLVTLFNVSSFFNDYSSLFYKTLSIIFAPESLFSSMLAGVLTLSLYEGAYISEIFKAGIESVSVTQKEAGEALGLSKFQVLRYVILPQTVKIVIPPLSGQFISTIKDSAIVSVVAVPELTFQGMEVMSSTYLTYEVWITITLTYLLMTLCFSLFMKFMENRLGKNY